MDEAAFTSILYMLGLSGFFSSRAFLPAFLTSAVMRYGAEIPLLNKLDMVVDMTAAPSWLANEYVFGTLAILAICELIADKVPEAQEALNLVDEYFKPVVATLTLFGVLSQGDASYLNEQMMQETASVMQGLPAVLYGGLVFYFAHLRAEVIGYLAAADPDDELGLRTIISWGEDAWVFLGFWLLLLIPIFMGVLVVFALALLWLIERHFRKQDERSRTPCPACQEEMYLSALACPHCAAANPQPLRLGVFGQSIAQAVDNPDAHRLRLLEKKRCRSCAAHLKKKCVAQSCPVCETAAFPTVEDAELYVERLTLRLPHVLGISALISLVPVLGFIVGIIYTRIKLVAPLKAYIPFHRNFLLKLVLRLLFVVLAILQIIPLAGAAAVPLLAFLTYLAYRRSFMRAARRMEEPTAPAAPLVEK